jgi:hypothetical protein
LIWPEGERYCCTSASELLPEKSDSLWRLLKKFLLGRGVLLGFGGGGRERRGVVYSWEPGTPRRGAARPVGSVQSRARWPLFPQEWQGKDGQFTGKCPLKRQRGQKADSKEWRMGWRRALMEMEGGRREEMSDLIVGEDLVMLGRRTWAEIPPLEVGEMP